MLRSLYSGVSGMKNFQTKLDVIGNNIANVGTTGFKKSRVTFQDTFSQQLAGAKAPAGGQGGTNAQEIGLGSSMGTIDTVQSEGAPQFTGRKLDIAIRGEGYLTVSDEEGETFYSRAGNLYLDQDSRLVTADGLYVNGVNGPIPQDATSLTIDEFGTVSYLNNENQVENAGQIQLATFANSEGLEKAGGNLYTASLNSGNPDVGNPGQNGKGTIQQGYLEMSNVELSDEFTEMIVGQRGFQANSKIITTSDEILQELLNLKR
ncbi:MULTISPECIES: flagellar basal body rod protein FlgG [Bacillus]|uniref:Flagellar hook protein FlgE n=2 Tax=Bacillus TaxID=1386 RepID=A0A0M4FPQ4_9BACI|nr:MULTISPECIES: flagellar basal body rod protein FlgG [Bacillus]ALC81060.1 flagellar biosynthesis protein FlgG [Bacillus gobiensis]MBP1080021.1 flagellar hook protein FlgE [Bacillus capparidis]MED1095409.1 flagellar basal body rod protein FlgG [Bacillus capparidis]